MVFHIERKLKNIAGSLVVTIPKLVCGLYGFRDGYIKKVLAIGAKNRV
jgi:hypothetical protein